MEVSQAIRARRSTRSFLPDPVSRRDMEGILDTARWCGSFVNCQPWKFTVLGGAVMAEWRDRLWQMFCDTQTEEKEYPMGPVPPPSPWGERGNAFREAIDGLMFPPGIDHWQERKDAYVRSGIVVRDAPTASIIHMDREMAQSPLHLLAAGGVPFRRDDNGLLGGGRHRQDHRYRLRRRSGGLLLQGLRQGFEAVEDGLERLGLGAGIGMGGRRLLDVDDGLGGGRPLAQRDVQQLVRERLVPGGDRLEALLVAVDHRRHDDGERDDDHDEEHDEEDRKPQRALARARLFGLDVLLERLEDGEVVHPVRLLEDPKRRRAAVFPGGVVSRFTCGCVKLFVVHI